MTASTRDDEPANADAGVAAPEVVATAAPQTPPKSRKNRIAKNAIRVALGLGLGLVIAEGAFWIRDGGSFPHLNLYVEDSDRGVRLRPGATERIRFSKNPITHVRINDEGYRGGEWPAKSSPDKEVIVVGDSQVLGLGVEENETFSSILQTSLGDGAIVRNLGVPTYGPPEYNGVIEEALTKRPAKTVVYVINLANDLFEAKRPNKERHVVWDGWAVRKESAPAPPTSFPGRELLYRDSHAVFALRGWLYGHGDEKVSEQGFASEGNWRDIGESAISAQSEHAKADEETVRLARLHDAQIKYASEMANASAQGLDQRLISDAISSPELHDANYDWDNPKFVPKSALYQASRMNPGDIVTTDSGENGRQVSVNAEQIRQGALLRIAVEKKLKAQAEAKHDKEVLGLFDNRDEAQKKVAELKNAPPPKFVPMSPLAPLLRDAKAISERHGARLFVVVLPIDVQVSKAEWTKYNAPPLDMAPTKVLNDDVVAAAHEIGVDAFDAFQTLSDAEPGAFLDGDLHMTPKGHKAVGEALAKALHAPHPATMPREGMPGLRSWLPQPSEWTVQTEINVRESDPAGCETKKLREYIGIFCRHKPLATGVVVTSGTDVLAGAVPGGSMLIAPVIAGQDLKATFAYEGASRDFVVKVTDAPETADVGFTKPLAARPDIAKAAATPETDAFCKCFVAQNPGRTCVDASALPDADCNRTYASDCKKLLACSAGDPATASSCATGFAHAGAAQRCKALCSTDPKNVIACTGGGHCTPWQGGEVCM